ncbi:MAG: hypothetical protein AB7P14_08185 [Blastocatellales bacterium]
MTKTEAVMLTEKDYQKTGKTARKVRFSELSQKAKQHSENVTARILTVTIAASGHH